jgi:3-oxoacyl-[acyl-carrier-protein] synthase II
VVTGVGLVSALGLDAAETFRRVMAGERGFGPLELFDGRGQRTATVAEVSGLRVVDVASGQQPLAWSRGDAMAVVAAREAMVRSGPPVPGEKLGAVLGVTTGGMYEAEGVLRAARFGKPPEESLAPLLSYPLSATAHRIAECVPGVCRTVTVSSACSSGAAAIVQAAIWLEQGHVDRVIAGGADALSLLTLTGFNALGATASEACRPFDARRAGLSLGEGAAFVVLETEVRARERGASVVALLTGWALGAEAHHLTQPEPSGATAVGLMRAALRRAGLHPQDIDYVNAHGTGTIHNDAMEARALREVFGPAIDRVFVSSSKGQLGHTLGAAGAIEAVITVLAVSGGEVPPTGGLQTPDPEAKLRHVVGTGCTAPIRAAFSNSFGFGGTGCVVVFVRPDQTGPDLGEEPETRPPAGSEVHSPYRQEVRTLSGRRSYQVGSRDPIKSGREHDRTRGF